MKIEDTIRSLSAYKCCIRYLDVVPIKRKARIKYEFEKKYM